MSHSTTMSTICSIALACCSTAALAQGTNSTEESSKQATQTLEVKPSQLAGAGALATEGPSFAISQARSGEGDQVDASLSDDESNKKVVNVSAGTRSLSDQAGTLSATENHKGDSTLGWSFKSSDLSALGGIESDPQITFRSSLTADHESKNSINKELFSQGRIIE